MTPSRREASPVAPSPSTEPSAPPNARRPAPTPTPPRLRAIAARPGDSASHRLMRWLPLAGALLALLGAAILGAVAMDDRRQGLAGLLAAASLFVAGKEGGIPIALAAGGRPWLVATMVLTADLASMCILYPLVDRGLDEVERRRGFGGATLAALRTRGERRKDLVVRYGQLGLYGFMLIPFAFNGPLQTAVVGRLAGLRPSRILPVLVAGVTTTTVAWTFLYASVFARARVVLPPWVPMSISLGVSALVVSLAMLASRREKAREDTAIQALSAAHPHSGADPPAPASPDAASIPRDPTGPGPGS